MSNDPTLVVLGASGDLAARLLFPALLSLEKRERLERPARDRLREAGLDEQTVPGQLARGDRPFRSGFRLEVLRQVPRSHRLPRRRLSVKSLSVLKDVLDGPAIFYLALPPGVFADAAETIAKAGLADETNGWRRLVIEKPFGTDLTDRDRRSTTSCRRAGGKTRSSASTTSSVRRRCRTSSCSGSPTGSSSRCCAPTTSTRSRSRLPKRSVSKGVPGTTTVSARCAT